MSAASPEPKTVTVKWWREVTQHFEHTVTEADVSPELWAALTGDEPVAAINASDEPHWEVFQERLPEWETPDNEVRYDIHERDLFDVTPDTASATKEA